MYLLYIGVIFAAAMLGFFTFFSSKSINHILAEVKYELIYSIMGLIALFEDAISKSVNYTKLKNKTGKIALITGGTKGIGVEVIKMLMKCDITVIMGCRKPEAGERLLTEIREQGVKTGDLKCYQLDVSSFSSVKNFADIIKQFYTEIHYLINCAGIMYMPYEESVDGYESQLATNYLGHFLLTHLLLPLLKKAGKPDDNARIVNVTSCAYLCGTIDFEDINKKERYIRFEAYSQSKLAQLLFSNYLNNLMKEEEECVRSSAVHPGLVDTDLFNETIIKMLFWWLIPMIFKTVKEGAMPIMYACIGNDVNDEGGTYISNCKVRDQNNMATDIMLQAKLFDFTKEIFKITDFGK